MTLRHLPRLTASLLALVLVCTAGCGLIYKQNIQQGNALEDEDLEQLYLGMTKRQVLFVLGSPAIRDPFHDQRWDYVQTYSRRGGKPTQRTVTLRFENDVLTDIIGFEPPEREAEESSVAAAAADSGAADPQKESIEAAQEEVLEPDIRGLGERAADDSDYDPRDVTNQRVPGDVTSPDIDG